MGRRKAKSSISIVSERGNIYVDGSTFDAEFRYPFWLLKVNQHILLPGFRRDHQKIIYVNGRRKGKADWREGSIPLHQYRRSEEYLIDQWLNRFSEVTGLACPASVRGYYNIKLNGRTYIVIVRRTSDNYLRCIVSRRDNGEYIGDFLFDTTLEHVYPRLVKCSLEKTFSIIIGYIMDCLVYATVSSSLNHRLEVTYK